MISSYKTVSKRAEGQYKEKGSKFIGIAVPCYSEEEAKRYLDMWRKEHYQARHLCYAWRFGLNMDVYRANDDGEPSNSAGAPILGQIQSFELSNILIGVVRYYGGTKLGVGGLINAYRTAAKEALEAAEIVEQEVFERVLLQFTYGQMPEVMNWLKQRGLEYYDQQFELDCQLEVALPLPDRDNLFEELNNFNLEITTKGVY